MNQWYKVRVYRGHLGAGRNDSVTAYIYAENVIKVIERYKNMPGVKRNIGKKNFPDIKKLSSEQSMILEDIIISEKRISLNKAKRTWYYSHFI